MIAPEQIELAARDNYWKKTGIAMAENSRSDMVIGFVDGADWALQQQRWIPVEEELPEQFQRVMFVVDLPGNYKHGKVYGGTYTGDPKSESASLANGFSTPGWGAPASHWMPSPEPPTETT